LDHGDASVRGDRHGLSMTSTANEWRKALKRTIRAISIGLLICCSPAAAQDAKPVEDFRRVCGEKAAAANAAETMTVEGRDGWMFLAGELRHVSVGEFWGEAAPRVSKATKPEWSDPLAAILDFKAGLEQAGIELLIVPVPPKAIVYPEMVGDLSSSAAAAEGTPRLDPDHQKFYELLRARGVDVLDLYSAFSAARFDEAGAVYCKQDSHWSGRGCEIAAKQIAATVANREWLKEATKETFDSEVRETEIDGDLWNAAKGTKPSKETLPLRSVGKREGGALQPVAPDTASPVILLGDSHTLVFHSGGDMHASGAGLADQLALELGFPVDLIGVRGSGATPARISLYRRVRGDADYLKKKKLLIWCFTAREFTEATSGWRIVPVTK
jgi:alginate O-acetyltransferase complex protein AlgJ